VRAHKIPGASNEDVQAPAGGVELRLDALLVRLQVDPAVTASLEGLSWVTTRPIGGATPFPARYEGMTITGDAPAEVLLPTGPGYLFEVKRDSAWPLVGFIDVGLPSGTVDVLLGESDPSLGTVHVVVTGQRLKPPNQVSVWLQPEDGPTPSVSVAAPARESWTGGVPPGRYNVRVRVRGVPPFDWAQAESTVDLVEVTAGGIETLEVQVLPAGMVTVSVSLPADVHPDEPPAVLLEVLEEDSGEWRRLNMHVPLPDGGRQVVSRLEPGRVYRSEDLFPPGELALRVSAEGWRTIEGVVEVQTGRENAWTAVLEPSEE
jgi:hypothetical protein